jgi:hypothetical protein
LQIEKLETLTQKDFVQLWVENNRSVNWNLVDVW